MASKTKKQGLAIEQMKISELSLDPANARKHDQRNIDAIKGSLARFGQQKPIVIDSHGVIRAGNGTFTAARELGWETIDAVTTSLEGIEAAAFAIADNRTAELAIWDNQELGKLLDELEKDGNLDGVGFNENEVLNLVSDLTGGLVDDGEEVPDPPDNPASRLGDLWLLGGSRVLCGDSTDADTVKRLLDGETPLLMVTDPPYGVEYDPQWRVDRGVHNSERMGKVENDDRVDWAEVWKLFPGDVAYVWHSGKYCGEAAASLFYAALEIRAELIWRKTKFVLSRGDYHWQHESCLYAVKKGRTAHWIGDRKQSTVWDIASKEDGDQSIHGTQKPIECMARPMRHHDVKQVFDPFLGSGTTLVAAYLQKRQCFGLELNPAYVDVIVRRWEKHSGESAILEGDGRTFAEVTAERLGASADEA